VPQNGAYHATGRSYTILYVLNTVHFRERATRYERKKYTGLTNGFAET
jgi:hypothetical protein